MKILQNLQARWRSLRARLPAGKQIRERLPRWVLILGWAGRDFVIDDALHWAAAIAFYGVLSVFPLVLAGVDVATWFVDLHGASQQASELLRHVMPRSDIVRDIIQKSIKDRHHINVLSFLFLIYAGGRVFAILIRALNIACDLKEIYGWFHRLLVELGMLVSIGLFFLGALVVSVVGPLFGDPLTPVPQLKGFVVGLIDWTLPPMLLLGGFFCLYKFVPRHRCNWQSALIGAAVATAGCVGAKPVFLVYIGKLASYSAVYGWLTFGVVLMIWAQILSVITLYGGELASHVQMMVYDGLSGEEVSRRHRVRSPGHNGQGAAKDGGERTA